MLKYGLEPDDVRLLKLEQDYRSGKLLSGELKQYCIDKITAFLKEHQQKRKKAEKVVDRFLV